jgi:hypothetical protein
MAKSREPREFDRRELVEELRKRGPALLRKLYQKASLDEIIQRSVDRTTYRAFHHLAEKPSIIFREWAATKLKSSQPLELGRIDSHADFNMLLCVLVGRLAKVWQRRGKKPICFGGKTKLVNLLLKALVRWEGLTDDQRAKLIPLLHVPLDSYTIAAVRRFADVGVRIPKGASMSFVKTQAMYDKFQQTMREVAAEAGVPPICVDLLAWDYAHAA